MVPITEPSFGLLDDITRLILLIKARIERDGVAPFTLCPEVFAEPPGITRDQPVGRLKNCRGGAVVLFQTNGFGPFEIFGKALDVLYSRTSPTIDRLVIVTDRNHRDRLTRQYPQPGVLNRVGVLKLIDQNRVETLLIVLQRFRRLQPQLMGTQ